MRPINSVSSVFVRQLTSAQKAQQSILKTPVSVPKVEISAPRKKSFLEKLSDFFCPSADDINKHLDVDIYSSSGSMY